MIAAAMTICLHSLMPSTDAISTMMGVRMMAPTVCETKVHTNTAKREKASMVTQTVRSASCRVDEMGSEISFSSDCKERQCVCLYILI